ncbi:MAG TPA: 1,2-phenylacetyl-CoA epoxidase subunit PaaC [Jatrophihabitantaceae bacterium]|nr:1,2-phenylacetyl-CoA epoxidase subunit PaaC [Jatrophihabitantaceae bacterium]
MHENDNAYESLAEAHGGEARWAYGTGFDDPLAGVDTTVPAGVDARELAATCLALGDDALVLAQRLASWVSCAPELEDEVALANIALDLLGQARLLLTRAAAADPSLRPAGAPEHIPDEDALAYFRDPDAFCNVVFAELDDGGDFAAAIVRLFVMSAWRLAIVQRLAAHADPVLSAIAVKAVAELTYHRDYAAGWLVRLGDGTDESHTRMQSAVDALLPRVAELYAADPLSAVETDAVIDDVLSTATLVRPRTSRVAIEGRAFQHTSALAELLAELQGVARAHPEASW